MRRVWRAVGLATLLALAPDCGGDGVHDAETREDTTAPAAPADAVTADAANAPEDTPLSFGTSKGSTLANLAWTRCDGSPVALHEDFAGARALWVVLQIPACPACREQHPFLETFYETYAPRGLNVLIVLGHDPADGGLYGAGYCALFEEEHAFPFPVLHDPDFRSAGELTDRGLPVQLLLDGDSVIRVREVGWHTELDPPWFTAQVEALLED